MTDQPRQPGDTAPPPAPAPDTAPDTAPPTTATTTPVATPTTAGTTAWLRQGARSALGLRPRWAGLHTTPALMLALLAVLVLLGLGFERLYLAGPATLQPHALVAGWFGTAALAFACWAAVARPAPAAGWGTGPGAAELFTMMTAQMVAIALVTGCVYLAAVRSGAFDGGAGRRVGWALWGLLLAWHALAQLLLLWREGSAGVDTRRAAAAVLLAGVLVHHLLPRQPRWLPDAPAQDTAAVPTPPRLSQETMELQAQLLRARLLDVGPGSDGSVDLYAITYAPFAEADVFMRESAMVAGVMADRFGAGGRSIELVNHPATERQWPWATPLNLQRAIQRAARVMNRDEDVLFIHLTSHGGADGQLAAAFEPLLPEPMTPQMLKAWLDDAGVRFRVISVSACYSGSWLEPLAGPGTLVMTAADAQHTSYGCGRKSELTFFGRALFDEQLRRTWSFEAAHAAARPVIQQREVEAGKDDGYSNPQISVGDAVREPLARLAAQREALTRR